MVIQYASDLHLEFPHNEEYLKANPLRPKGEVLLLAGDIVPFAAMDKFNDFFNYISDNFKTTYWIPGNHEYYYFDAATKCGTLNEKIRSNVFLVNNIAILHENTNLIFSTLWSKISPANQFKIESKVSDFHVIKYNGNRFTSEQFNEFHEESLSFIKQEIHLSKADNTVVVSHHVPTFLNYPKKYKASALNEAFVVELYELIEYSTINYWIYGHHHLNIPDFEIGETKMLTNQVGYVKYNEHELFDHEKVLQL